MSETTLLKLKPVIYPYIKGGVALAILAAISYLALSQFLHIAREKLSQFVSTSIIAQAEQGVVYLSIFLVFAGSVWLAVGILQRNAYSYLLTNRRIIVKRTLLSQGTRSIPYERISDVLVSQTWMGRLLNYGDVVCVTMSGYGILDHERYKSAGYVRELDSVPNPKKVADFVLAQKGAPSR
jgi:uncharacterized membrane protein YdbT with pleckstrin-like domain